MPADGPGSVSVNTGSNNYCNCQLPRNLLSVHGSATAALHLDFGVVTLLSLLQKTFINIGFSPAHYFNYLLVIGGYVSSSVCLIVCLLSALLKMLWTDCMKFYGGVPGGKRNKWLDFGSNPDTHLVCKRISLNFWKPVAYRSQPSCMETLWLFKNSVQHTK